MNPKPIPPPLFKECEVEDCPAPAQNGDVCEYCIDEDLEDTLDSDQEKSNGDNGEESKDN